jgi:2-hydroxychromene-2-carboxylate isomerase
MFLLSVLKVRRVHSPSSLSRIFHFLESSSGTVFTCVLNITLFGNNANGKKDKDVWIGRERLRWAKVFNIPMQNRAPEGFPPRTLEIMRTLCALTALHPGEEGQKPLTRCLDALYEAYWVEHKKTNEKDVLDEVLSSVLGKEEAAKGELF